MKTNWIFFVLIGLAAIPFGVCVSEEFIPFPWGHLLLVSGSIVWLPIGWFLGKPGKITPWVFVLAMPGLLFISSGIAGEDYGQAYDDCMQNGEQLRVALSQYQKKHGEYPKSLSQLGWPCLPGERRIGKTILHYEGYKDGYRIYFSGGPTSVIATESKPFEQLFM